VSGGYQLDQRTSVNDVNNCGSACIHLLSFVLLHPRLRILLAMYSEATYSLHHCVNASLLLYSLHASAHVHCSESAQLRSAHPTPSLSHICFALHCNRRIHANQQPLLSLCSQCAATHHDHCAAIIIDCPHLLGCIANHVDEQRADQYTVYVIIRMRRERCEMQSLIDTDCSWTFTTGASVADACIRKCRN
jgi:hypothetical protein